MQLSRFRTLTWPWIALCAGLIACVGCTPPPEGRADFNGLTEVHDAAQKKDIAKLEELFKKGASPDVPDIDGVTPLHRAARDGDLEVAHVLLQNWAHPNVTTHAGWTALHLAAREGHSKMVEMLIQFGADVRATTPDGRTALHWACAANDAASVATLVSDWALKVAEDGQSNINDKDKKGKTALHLTMDNNNWDLVATLIAKGADVSLPNVDGTPPLIQTIKAKQDAVATLMLSNKADPNAKDSSGKTALGYAIEGGAQALAQTIYQYGGR